jgi:hypothetical protein
MTGFFADGRVTMTTYRKSAKARNVARDRAGRVPRRERLRTHDVRGALVRGRGRCARGRWRCRARSQRGAESVGSVTTRVADRMASGKRVFLDVEPDDARFVDRFWSE